MNEQQINVHLKHIPNYEGSFALDELEKIEIKTHPEFFVVNLDNREGGGTHWLAFAVYQNSIYICDSLGGLLPNKKFPKRLINFLHVMTHKRKLYISKQLQPLDSKQCGQYCVLFISEMSRTNSFYSFLSLFTNDFKQNDKIVSFLFGY